MMTMMLKYRYVCKVCFPLTENVSSLVYDVAVCNFANGVFAGKRMVSSQGSEWCLRREANGVFAEKRMVANCLNCDL
jgi:hypothetical protein